MLISHVRGGWLVRDVLVEELHVGEAFGGFGGSARVTFLRDEINPGQRDRAEMRTFPDLTSTNQPNIAAGAARSTACWRRLGPSHPVKRYDVPMVHLLAGAQPVMSLWPLRIRRGPST